MIPKPAACKGCPLYGNGMGFVPDDIRHASPAVGVWLQNPGATEEQKGVPACGTTGEILNKELLPAAGLQRKDVNVSNVLRCRLNGSNEMPKGKVLVDAVKHCRVHDGSLPQHTLVLGAHAWNLFAPPGSITDWRGYCHPTVPGVFASLHPADLLRNPKMRLALLADMKKFARFTQGLWPKPIPPYKVVAKGQDVGLVKQWVEEALQRAPFVALDTEFTRGANPWLTLLGMHWPGEQWGVQIEVDKFGGPPRQWLADILRDVLRRVPIVFQNAMADIPVIDRNLHIPNNEYTRIHDTMLAHAVLWSDWPHDLEFLASIYGKHEKMKHLARTNPSLYNWGDCVETANVWQGVAAELTRDPGSKGIYELQSIPLVPVILKRAKLGLRVNQPRIKELSQQLSQDVTVANGIAKAWLGRDINLASPAQVLHYVQGAGFSMPKTKGGPSVGGDVIATLRMQVAPFDADEEQRTGFSPGYILQRIADFDADAILEARAMFAAAQQVLTHYVRPLEGVERVYPSMKIHAQASGRWSTTDPPLAQLPNHLRDIVIPDPGESWITWDWDQIELRLLAALAADKPYLEAFKHGWDIHTLNACAIFGLAEPPDKGDPHKSPLAAAWRQACSWAGKDDPRRVFAKRFVYRLNYGGEPRTAGDIPGAKQLNLTPNRLVQASERYLAAHPELATWRSRVASDARTSRKSRTFMGRLRRLLSGGPSSTREAYNHPMQGGVSDILNTVTVRIAHELPTCTLVQTMHDSATWAVPDPQVTDALARIRSILSEPWQVGEVSVEIPATFKSIVIGEEHAK